MSALISTLGFLLMRRPWSALSRSCSTAPRKSPNSWWSHPHRLGQWDLAAALRAAGSADLVIIKRTWLQFGSRFA
jgi:hypothetical protein